MKRQDLVKYHSQSLSEIEEKISELSQKLVELQMKKELGQLKNVHEPITIRKDIARLKTIVRHKQLVEATQTNTK